MGRVSRSFRVGAIPPYVRPDWVMAAALAHVDNYYIMNVERTKTLLLWALTKRLHYGGRNKADTRIQTRTNSKGNNKESNKGNNKRKEIRKEGSKEKGKEKKKDKKGTRDGNKRNKE